MHNKILTKFPYGFYKTSERRRCIKRECKGAEEHESKQDTKIKNGKAATNVLYLKMGIQLKVNVGSNYNSKDVEFINKHTNRLTKLIIAEFLSRDPNNLETKKAKIFQQAQSTCFPW